MQKFRWLCILIPMLFCVHFLASVSEIYYNLARANCRIIIVCIDEDDGYDIRVRGTVLRQSTIEKKG